VNIGPAETSPRMASTGPWNHETVNGIETLADNADDYARANRKTKGRNQWAPTPLNRCAKHRLD
jgi:hypothetical protein